MAGIFLSGGSGSGKTTFCKTISSHYSIPLIIDVLRGIHKKCPEISDLPKNEKQLIYATEYLKLHHTTEPSQFISDRSILNVLAFWGMNPDVAQYLGLQTKQPDLIILIPVPTYKWYVDHIDYFADPIRIDTYKARIGEKTAFLGRSEVATLFYEQDREMFDSMERMCEHLEWPFFIPEIDRKNIDGFQAQWQFQAHDLVMQTWEIAPRTLEDLPEEQQQQILRNDESKVAKMKAKEAPIEEYLNRLEGGDLDDTTSTSTED